MTLDNYIPIVCQRREVDCQVCPDSIRKDCQFYQSNLRTATLMIQALNSYCGRTGEEYETKETEEREI